MKEVSYRGQQIRPIPTDTHIPPLTFCVSTAMDEKDEDAVPLRPAVTADGMDDDEAVRVDKLCDDCLLHALNKVLDCCC
jgi:hypothetical protein